MILMIKMMIHKNANRRSSIFNYKLKNEFDEILYFYYISITLVHAKLF